MSFPLADWVLGHADVPHNLARSGMEGSLRTVPRLLRRRPDPDPERLRAVLGRLNGVPSRRVFLTHGASEGNALALLYLRRRLGSGRAAPPTLYAPVPEYPPIPDAAREVGFEIAERPDGADAIALSAPRNPFGTPVPMGDIARLSEDTAAILVDQTFREFSVAAPVTRSRLPNLWATGSSTKVYGAEDIRVGFVIAPDAEREAFARLHGLFLDRLPPVSVSSALAILDHRDEALAEARGILRRNETALRAAFDEVPRLAAPVWFDRAADGFDGDAFSHRLLRQGILVCPGSFFGVRNGVRLCLTRRSFPEDLDAYRRVRERTAGIRRPAP